MTISQETLDRILAAADRVDIIETLSRYHQVVDARQWDRLGEVFVSDAECEYVGMSELFGLPDDNMRGLDNIRAWLIDGLEGRATTMHYMTNHVCEIEGDEARTRSYMFNARGAGIYEVDHVRTTEGWRIRRLWLEHRFDPQTVAELRDEREQLLAARKTTI